MRRIHAALVGHDSCVAFSAGLHRLRRACGLDVVVRPWCDVEAVPLTGGEGGPPLVVTDLPPLGSSGTFPTEQLRELERVLLREPRPELIVFAHALPRDLRLSLGTKGVRDFVIMNDEDLPRLIQRVLSKVLLPRWITDFVGALPGRALSFDQELGLRSFLLAPGGPNPEEVFAEGCGEEVAGLERRLVNAGLPPLEEICTLGVLAHLCSKVREPEGADAALRALGLDWDDVRGRSGSFLEAPLDLVRRGDPGCVVEALARRLRSHRNAAREDEVFPDDNPVWETLTRLYEEHAEGMRWLAMAQGLGEMEADDIVHKVWCSLLAREKCDIGGGYLFQAVRIEARMLLSRTARRAELLVQERPKAWWYESEPVKAPREIWPAIEEPIQALREPGRTVFRLRRMVEWPAREVAAHIGRSPNAVELILRRTLIDLRRRLQELGVVPKSLDPRGW